MYTNITFHFNAGNQLERLLILESEFGALSEFMPAVDAVIDYVTMVRFPCSLHDWFLTMASMC